MNPETISLLSLIVSGVVAIGGLALVFSNRKKNLGDAFSQMQKALETLQKNYNDLRKDFDALRVSYNNLEIHNRALTEQLVENRIPPITMAEAVKLSQKKGRTK